MPHSICFRASCIRCNSKKYSYSCKDVLREVVNFMIPNTYDWKVDLVNYNMEVVLLMIEH
jgi:hypothetical protein